MSEFHFTTSVEEWTKIRNCWKKIENTIKTNQDLQECQLLLNDRLFDKQETNDISIDTLNTLMTEIDNETKTNDDENEKIKKQQKSNQETATKNEEIPSAVLELIDTPVQFFFSADHCTAVFCVYFAFFRFLVVVLLWLV